MRRKRIAKKVVSVVCAGALMATMTPAAAFAQVGEALTEVTRALRQVEAGVGTVGSAQPPVQTVSCPYHVTIMGTPSNADDAQYGAAGDAKVTLADGTVLNYHASCKTFADVNPATGDYYHKCGTEYYVLPEMDDAESTYAEGITRAPGAQGNLASNRRILQHDKCGAYFDQYGRYYHKAVNDAGYEEILAYDDSHQVGTIDDFGTDGTKAAVQDLRTQNGDPDPDLVNIYSHQCTGITATDATKQKNIYFDDDGTHYFHHCDASEFTGLSYTEKDPSTGNSTTTILDADRGYDPDGKYKLIGEDPELVQNAGGNYVCDDCGLVIDAQGRLVNDWTITPSQAHKNQYQITAPIFVTFGAGKTDGQTNEPYDIADPPTKMTTDCSFSNQGVNPVYISGLECRPSEQGSIERVFEAADPDVNNGDMGSLFSFYTRGQTDTSKQFHFAANVYDNGGAGTRPALNVRDLGYSFVLNEGDTLDCTYRLNLTNTEDVANANAKVREDAVEAGGNQASLAVAKVKYTFTPYDFIFYYTDSKDANGNYLSVSDPNAKITYKTAAEVKNDALTLAQHATTQGVTDPEFEELISVDGHGQQLDLYTHYKNLMMSKSWIETNASTHEGYYPEGRYHCALRSGESWYGLRIVALNHHNTGSYLGSDNNYSLDGKAGLTFEFENALPSSYKWATKLFSAKPGWKNSEIRANMNPDSLLGQEAVSVNGSDQNLIWDMFPSSVTSLIEPIIKPSTKPGSNTRFLSQDYFFIENQFEFIADATLTTNAIHNSGFMMGFYEGIAQNQRVIQNGESCDSTEPRPWAVKRTISGSAEYRFASNLQIYPYGGSTSLYVLGREITSTGSVTDRHQLKDDSFVFTSKVVPVFCF